MTTVQPGLIKLCGMSRPENVLEANRLQPDFVGIVVDYPSSPRSRNLREAAELASLSEVPVVAVVVAPAPERFAFLVAKLQPAAVQLSGDETVEEVSDLRRTQRSVEIWKVLHLRKQPSDREIERAEREAELFAQTGVSRIMIDTRAAGSLPGGTGEVASWSAAASLVKRVSSPVILAGGLTSQNVATAITLTRPAGVDVSSGTESAPGIKDPVRMAAFVDAARAAFRTIGDGPRVVSPDGA